MTIAFTRSADLPGGCQLHTWVLLSANATGDSVELPGAADRSVQFAGTWGGATAALQGSNDGSTWGALTNPATGSAITATADNNIAAVVENPRYIRAILTTVGTGASVSAYMLSRTT